CKYDGRNRDRPRQQRPRRTCGPPYWTLSPRPVPFPQNKSSSAHLPLAICLTSALLQKPVPADDSNDASRTEFALGYDWVDVRDDADEGEHTFTFTL
ncbi:hypothetical protein EV363DRAFT_1235249, partial [Boletus edulis]